MNRKSRLFKKIKKIKLKTKKLKVYLNSIDRQIETDIDSILIDRMHFCQKRYAKKLAEYRKTKKAIKTLLKQKIK